MKKLIALPLLYLSMSSVYAGLLESPTKASDNSPLLIRVRGIGVLPDVSSSPITLINGKVTQISNEVVPELDFNYFFNSNISAELILATTRHTVKATGTALGTINLGKVNLLPPTLTALYHFLPNKTVNPYLGGGVNYTHFYNVNPGKIATSIKYDDGFGGVVQAGVDMQVTPSWSINIDVKKVFLDTNVTVSALGLKPKTTVTINPLIVGLGVGYRV